MVSGWRQAAAAAAGAMLVVCAGISMVSPPSSSPSSSFTSLLSKIASSVPSVKPGPSPTRVKDAKKAPKRTGLEAQVSVLMQEEEEDARKEKRMARRKERVALQMGNIGGPNTQDSSRYLGIFSPSRRQKMEMNALRSKFVELRRAEQEDKVARKKIQLQIDEDISKLASRQISAHEAAEKASAAAEKRAAARAMKTATKLSAIMAKRSKEKKVKIVPASSYKSTAEQVLTDMSELLLKLPSVRQALKQSLDIKELEIAEQIAKSLNQTWNSTLTPIDPKIIAEVAVAEAEAKKNNMPEVNVTVVPIAEDLQKAFEQAKKEIAISGKVSGK